MFRAFLLLALLVAALVAAPVQPAAADTGLTAAVAGTYFPRYDDASLHAIAQARVAELAACACLNHDGMRAGTAEVIGYNSGYANPTTEVVRAWHRSADHDAILSNRSYGRIGCAEQVSDGTHWFACVLTPGPLPPAAAPAGVFLLPNTALPPGG